MGRSDRAVGEALLSSIASRTAEIAERNPDVVGLQEAYWPLNIVQHGQELSITVMSYAGAMGFGFTTARSAIPDACELSAAQLAALDELVRCSPGAAATAAQHAPRKAVAKKVVKRERPSTGERAA